MSGELKAARKTGDHLTPENAKARVTTQKRGGDVTPEGTKARFSGDPMTNSMTPGFVPRIIKGPQGDSKTTINPIK